MGFGSRPTHTTSQLAWFVEPSPFNLILLVFYGIFMKSLSVIEFEIKRFTYNEGTVLK